MLYKKKSYTISSTAGLIIFVIIIGISQLAIAEIVYSDGAHYTISSYIDGNVTVTGCARVGEPLQNTAVDIINGGDINGNVTVGSLGIVNLTGGRIQGDLVSTADLGNIHIASGTVLGSVKVTGDTPLHISSADIDGNIYFGRSNDSFSITDSIIGGDITTAAVNFSNVSLSNTTVNGVLRSVVAPKMLISDCLLNSGIEASSFSAFSLFDSGIVGDVVASDFATIYIRGEGFKVNGIDYTFGSLSSFGFGNVTGLASSGQLIDFDFSINDNAEIFLIPEPATLIFLGIGCLFLGKKFKVLQK